MAKRKPRLKVSELIEELSKCNPDAEVFVSFGESSESGTWWECNYYILGCRQMDNRNEVELDREQ